MNAPSISVITPCFNAAAFLGQAIESILSQTLKPDELIVVDDGSTDESLAIARSFGALVKVIEQPHLGDAPARNRGLRESRGNLIAFLDADDLWPEHSLEERAQHLEANPHLGWVNGIVEQFVSDCAPQELLRIHPEGAARLPGSMLIRRSTFEHVGPFDEAIAVGFMIEWCSRAEQRGVSGACIERVVLRRRIHAANSMHDHQKVKTNYLRALRAAVQHKRMAAE